MEFHEKLDFFMNITKTGNSFLGRKVNLDPSYISRIRRGKRGPLKDEAIIGSIADYFARSCTDDYQRKAITDALKLNCCPADSSELSHYIKEWLIDKKQRDVKSIDDFLNSFKMTKSKPESIQMKQQNDFEVCPVLDEISVYYGIEGKQQAAAYFLNDVIASKQPQTLLLCSDEATDWMTEDREFAAKWSRLMATALSKGNKIKIIHTVSRNLDEMLHAISQWMPLYMSGAIEPYYYPKKRDGLFKKTLFISPGISAVVASSVGSMVCQAANLLIRDEAAIDAFTAEFDQYLSQCKPLMRIFSSAEDKKYFDTLTEFEKEKSNSIIRTESLSLVTMPDTLASEIIGRFNAPDLNLGFYHKNRKQTFEENLETNTLFEIIPKFDLKMINRNEVIVSFSYMMNGSVLHYTKDEYVKHLEHIAYLLEEHKNFHIKMIEGVVDSSYTVYAKDDIGAVVVKTASSPVLMAINEKNLSYAFWDYLISTIGDLDYHHPNDKKELYELKEYINKIKGS